MHVLLAWSDRNVFNLFIIKCYKPPINVSRAKTICQHMFMSTQSRQLRRKLNISRPDRTRATRSSDPDVTGTFATWLCKKDFRNRKRKRSTFVSPLIFKYIYLALNESWAILQGPLPPKPRYLGTQIHAFYVLSIWPRGNGESVDKLSSGCRNVLNGFLRAVGPSANSSKWALFQLPSQLRFVFAVKSI